MYYLYMITLIDLLDEIKQIVNFKKKKLLTENKSQEEKQLPIERLTFKKKFNFELLNNLDSSNNDKFGPIISDYFSPFSSRITRYGVIKQFGESQTNISFYSSLVTILCEYSNPELKKSFDFSQNATYVSLADELVKYMISVVELMNFGKKSFISKTLDWKKNELIKSLKFKECDKTILGLFAYVFDMNILIINVSSDNLMAIYPEEKYNKYKNTIVMTLYNNTFEPIKFDDSFIWKFKTIHEQYDESSNNYNLLLKLMTINYSTFNSLNVSLVSDQNKHFKHAQQDELYCIPEIY